MRKIVKSSEVLFTEIDRKDGCFPDQSKKKEAEINYLETQIDRRLNEVEKDIENRISNANKQAQLIISEAYEDSKEIFNNAKADGFDSGYIQGLETGKAEAKKIIDEALSIKKQIIQEKQVMISKLERQIVTLVTSSIEKILGDKIHESSEIILGLIKQGLEKCTYTESLVLRISPEDYEYVVEVKDKVLCLAENIDDITIKKDGSLKKGSCVLDTVSGSIDSSIQTQMDNLFNLFRDLLRNE